MTPRQRVHAALRREPVDRVPIFMWFHPEAAARLAARLEIAPALVGAAMGDDIRQAWVNNNASMEAVALGDGERYTDPWGIEWVKEGAFNQIHRSPLAGMEPEAMEGYAFPRGRIDELLAHMEPVAAGREDCFLGCDVSPCVFEIFWRLRGMMDAFLDLGSEEPHALRLLERAADFSLALAEAACDRFPLDWLWTGDDIGGQEGMMLGPDCWRRHVKPHLARIFAAGKSRGLWVAYHSCGALSPVIGDLVEIGLDVLNPIQCNCPGMHPADLKREFGDRLAFMGGVDTQGLLPRGTAGEVRRATETLLETMTAGGGGYILAASHTIPPETPEENIFAMYAAAGVSREEIFDRAAALRARVTA